jgi:hypothetical protein
MLAAPYQIATGEENCRCQNHFGMDERGEVAFEGFFSALAQFAGNQLIRNGVDTRSLLADIPKLRLTQHFS